MNTLFHVPNLAVWRAGDSVWVNYYRFSAEQCSFGGYMRTRALAKEASRHVPMPTLYRVKVTFK